MRAADALAPAAGAAALRAWTSTRAAALRLAQVRPVLLLTPLVAVQWAILVTLALSRPHDGWLFYNGGDATEYWAEQWAVAHGWVPHAVLGYGLSVLYAWVPRLVGTTLLEGLPVIMALQALVLVPLALVLVYAVARRIAGRLFALLAAVLWVVTPLAAIRLFRASYRSDYLDYFLVPHGYGLTDMADFASLVVVLAVTLFVFRALDDGRRGDALVAGLLLGLAVGIKPANALIVPAFGLAFLVGRRAGHLLPAALGVVPAVLTLVLWKQKGLGTLPLLSVPQLHEASGVSIPGLNTSRYITFTWAKLHENLLEFHEVFWEVRLLEFIPLAGAFALIRKAPAKGLYVTLWFAGFMVFKGGTPEASVYATSFYRLGEPGFPAFLLMLASLVLLVPGWGRRAAAVRGPDRPLRLTRGTGAAFALAGLLPLLVVAALSPAPAGAVVRNGRTSTEAPISASLGLRAERTAGGGVRLSWRRVHTGSSSTFFVLYRYRGGDGCDYGEPGAKECVIDTAPLAVTRQTSFVDRRPPAGRVSYRVAMAANFVGDPSQGGDMVLLSPAAPAPAG